LIILGPYKEDVKSCNNIPYYFESVLSCVSKMNFLNCPASDIKSKSTNYVAVKTFVETNRMCGYGTDGAFAVPLEFWSDKAYVSVNSKVK
jgi:hypothetical protein